MAQWTKALRCLLKSAFFWTIVIRIAFLFAVPRHIQGDAVDYQVMARNFANGHGISRCQVEPYPPSASRPPLYPLILGVLYRYGASQKDAYVYLNLFLDLISMIFAFRWARLMKFAWAPFVPWVIGLCPLLITYGMYPTTENISIMLFFIALYLTCKGRTAWGGVFWGFLTLTRSYYLLFPFALIVFRPYRGLSRGSIAVLAATSLLAPSLWMLRNRIELNRIVFTQSSGMGWQSYQGLCVTNFDWWRPEHVAKILNSPLMMKIAHAHCREEDDLAELDRQAVEEVKACVAEKPFEVFRNIISKGINLFVNWGLITPYNIVPLVIQELVNAVLIFYWWCVAWILIRRKWGAKSQALLQDSIHFSLLNIGYIVAVTIPFAVDSRYLLPPFLMLLVCIFELVKTPSRLVEAGFRFGKLGIHKK